MFAAFLAAASQVSIPIQPVPVNLALVAVLTGGGVLGKKYGTLCVAVYILLGCTGVPVFSSLRGGLSVITGMTGGYILGYLPAAFLTGLVCEKTKRLSAVILAMTTSVLVCYAVGTAWFCVLTGTSAREALAICVLPFLPVDVLKIITASIIVKKVKIG